MSAVFSAQVDTTHTIQSDMTLRNLAESCVKTVRRMPIPLGFLWRGIGQALVFFVGASAGGVVLAAIVTVAGWVYRAATGGG